ncbi:MAG: GNAT family N-acetyltransferase [Deltaproteobacteria bacterium]|nr:GNAT family N-acetyltransferase [Deltaproteobacteria bacterium]
MSRVIVAGEKFEGDRVYLRLVELSDCTDRYVAWLADPEVNKYLETRYAEQTLEMIRSFVGGMIESPHSYLFAICEMNGGRHVGNVKIGPIVPRHLFADVSYFIGEREAWGKGYGTEAVRLVTKIGFERLGLHRCQAGLYESNVGSHRLLEKAGYTYEGRLSKQLRIEDRWEDHVWFGALKDQWS